MHTFYKDIVFELNLVNWKGKGKKKTPRKKCQQNVGKLLNIPFKCHKCSCSKTVEKYDTEL